MNVFVLVTNVLLIVLFLLMIIGSWRDFRAQEKALRKLGDAELALRNAEALLRKAKAERRGEDGE